MAAEAKFDFSRSLDKEEEKCRQVTSVFSACRKPLCPVLGFSGSLRARCSHSSGLTPVTDHGADRAAAARHKHNVPRMHGETALHGGLRRPAVTEIRGTV